MKRGVKHSRKSGIFGLINISLIIMVAIILINIKLVGSFSLSDCDSVPSGGTCEIPAGIYNEQLILHNGLTYVMSPGVILNYSSAVTYIGAITDNGLAVNTTIVGSGEIVANGRASGISISNSFSNVSITVKNITLKGNGYAAIDIRGSLIFHGDVNCPNSYTYACIATQSNEGTNVLINGNVNASLAYGLLAGGGNVTVIGSNITSGGNSAMHCSNGYCWLFDGHLTSTGLFGLEFSGGRGYVKNSVIESKRLAQYEGDAISKYSGELLTLEDSTLLSAREDAYSVGSQGSPLTYGIYLIGTVYVNKPVESTVPISGPGQLVMMVPDPADVNKDDVVNIIDLAIVIFNQGRNSGQGNWNYYKYLDLDGDSNIDWDDVRIVMSKM